MDMMRLSHSRLRTFQKCPRAYLYQYKLDRVPARTTDALAFGRLWHEIMEVYWTDGRGAAIEYALTVAPQVDPIDSAKVSALLEHYDPPIDDYEVEGVEVPFEIPVTDPDTGEEVEGVLVQGFADALLREKSTGRLLVRECKTTSSEVIGFGPFWQTIGFDIQPLIYALAFGAEGAVYDVVRKPALRLSAADRKAGGEAYVEQVIAYRSRVSDTIADRPDEFYQFRPLWKSPEDLVEASRVLHGAVTLLLYADSFNIAPQYSGNCRTPFTCPYLDVCAGRAQLDDDGLFQDRQEVSP